jgi:hypothetical protein
VVRVPGYRHRGLVFTFGRNQIFREAVVPKRDQLGLVKIIGELLELKVADPV